MYLKKLALVLFACLLLFVYCSVLSAQILSPSEQHQLVDMLNTAGFDSTDVNFLKDWDASTKFKLSAQVDALNNPWNYIKLLDKLKDTLNYHFSDYRAKQYDSDTRYSLLSRLAKFLKVKYDEFPSYDFYDSEVIWDPDDRSIKNVPKDYLDYIKFHFSKDSYAETLDNYNVSLSPLQYDSLSCFLYQLWQENEDSLKYKDFYKETYPKIDNTISMEDGKKLLYVMTMYDPDNDFTDNVVVTPEGLRYRTGRPSKPLLPFEKWLYYRASAEKLSRLVANYKFTNKKPIYLKSEWGTVIIGSMGNDRYPNNKRLKNSPPCLIIEPGGDDIYECPLYADNKHPFYIVIDLKGNDIYLNTDIGREMSVIHGFGYLHDFEGNDMYIGGDFALSARNGLQMNIDDKGDDYYSTGLFSQGAAMFGISVLQDNEGNDTYTATEFAQGMGGTKGLGLLLDGKGNDVYYVGGKYLHKPLAPFDYRSMGQGFGFGMRPDLAGGIGILYDGEGNDRYSGGVYAQGVAYWYAIGALFDEKGNDYYDAVYYPQGSGIHLANGALIDMEGEDHYYSKHGPGQGNGHDWSVGVFIDKKGNDHYSIEGGNGLALANSVGIFVDSEGDDKFEQRNPSNYGFASSARESGGLGLFLDAGGKDVYPDSAKTDNKTWQQGTYGIGRDVELNVPAKTKVEELAEESVADVDSLAAIDELFGISSEWEVGSAAKRVKLAREYLLKRESEAVPYAIKMKMDTKSGLEYRALAEITKKSTLMQAFLYAVLHDVDSLKVKNAIALISEKGDSLAVDSISVFLARNKYIPTVLSALGHFKTTQSLELIKPWLAHHTEKYRYLAARSLKAMNTIDSIALLRKMDKDSSFLIKAMVRQLPATDK